MNDLSRASPPVKGIFHMFNQTWYLSKITPLDFQAKKFTLLISPNFNSFRDKNTKMSVYGWRNLHRWQIFYTPTGKDGRDKSHLCVPRFSFIFAHKNRWLLGWKLQGGLFTKRRCALPDFAASCQHFPLSWNTERAFCSHSPFKGNHQHKSDMTHITSCEQN